MLSQQLEYISSIEPAQGFHFYLTTRLLSQPPPECTSLALQFILPPIIFADPYELDLHRALSHKQSIEPDLELPVTAVDPRATILDVNITIPRPSDRPLSVTLPLHARYGDTRDSASDAYERIRLAPPRVTLFCGSRDMNDIKLASSTQDMVIRIPVGLTSELKTVEIGTIVVILATFVYLLAAFFKTARRLKTGYHDKVE